MAFSKVKISPVCSIGDVIQFEWTSATNNDNDQIYDHAAIVVGFETDGTPKVAAHTTDHYDLIYTAFKPWEKIRFIHIERSNGYPPIKADIIQGNDDAGTITWLPNLCGYSGLQNDYEIYLGRCFGTGTDITSGLQFRNINIPPGAQVKYAYLRFTVDGPFTVPLQLKIYGENTGTPVAFSSSNPPESASRQLTNDFTEWNIEDTNPNDGIDTLTWNLGMRRTTPDLSPFISAIVNGSWLYGNTLSIIIKNDTPLGDPMPVRRVIGYERATSYLPAGYSPARLIAAYDLGTPVSWPPIQESTPFYSVGAKDGWILESSETSEKGGTYNANYTLFNLGDDGSDRQYRAILHFDTSGLPDNAAITTVVLKIKKWGISGTDPFTTHGNLSVDIRKPHFGTNANLAKSDFEASATPGGLAGAGIFNPVPSGDWYTATLNSAAFPYINLIGTTQIRLAFTLGDDDDLNPDYILFFSGNHLVPEDHPQLIICSTA